MNLRDRLTLAFGVSPLIAFPVTMFLLWVWQVGTRVFLGVPGHGFWGELDFSALLSLFATLCAYLVTLVLGIPVTLALRKHHLFRAGVMASAGGLAGAVPFLYWLPDSWELMSVSVPNGVAVAWLVWRISTGSARSLPKPPSNDMERRTDMLTVLYDGRCALCRRAQSWLESQPKFVPLEYVAAGSQEARRRFPGLDHDNTLVDLTVVSFNGEVYHGAKAWIMCLWALKKYRGTALRLATPELMPTAKRVIAWVSRNRFNIGQAPAWKT